MTTSPANDCNNYINATYKEASNCLKAELFTACIVMCRKTVELLCRAFEITEPRTLEEKIKKLKDQEIIDKMLYDWANALKDFGNDAAHTYKIFSQEDARDVLDFTYYLVEYCLDFRSRFSALIERRKNSKSSIPVDNQEQVDKITLTDTDINTLLQALKDTEESIKYYASVILIHADKEIEEVIRVLISFLKSKKFRQKASDGLKRIGEKAVPQLIEVMIDKSNKEAQLLALNILGEMSSVAQLAVPPIIDLLANTENNDIRERATINLEKLGIQAVIPFVKMYKEKLHSPSSSTEMHRCG